jgi:hypothetical protein
MDGSGIDFVLLPVIILPCLTVWLISIFYADAHPVPKQGASLPRADESQAANLVEVSPAAGQPTVPGQRIAQSEILDDATSVR